MPEKLCGMVLLTIFRELWELKILVDLLQKDMKKITLAILYLNRVLLYYYFCNRVDNCFSIIPSGRFVICCGWLRVYMNVVSFLAGLATYIFSIILVHSDIKATEYFKINWRYLHFHVSFETFHLLLQKYIWMLTTSNPYKVG